ncbi:MAG: hypothetical protein R6V15_02325 [Desulfotignum sp.]
MKPSLFFFVVVAAMIGFSGISVWGSDLEGKKSTQTPGHDIAIEDIYIDLATMHRYVKNPDDTYTEYNRRGSFFKIVSPELPLLTTRPHVVPIKGNCYLLYVNKQMAGQALPMTLKTANESHPEGWFLEKALVDLKHTGH